MTIQKTLEFLDAGNEKIILKSKDFGQSFKKESKAQEYSVFFRNDWLGDVWLLEREFDFLKDREDTISNELKDINFFMDWKTAQIFIATLIDLGWIAR